MYNHRQSTVRSGRKCFLCHNTRYRSKNCRLFRFPARGTAMWSRWLTVMALAEEDVRPDEHPRLCQRHFERKDFLTRELSGMAVPIRNLHRVKDKKAPVMEEQQLALDGRRLLEQEAFDEKDMGSDETVGENVSEYGEVEEELDGLVESEQNASPSVLPLVLEEQPAEAKATAVEQPALNCNIPQHEALEELLRLERARVRKLFKINAHQKSVLEEQRNLLLQLGVECVVLEQDLSSDDSE
ncbi:AGAP005932-PA [Anopheles gambiae str. PEST]|uniref:AGAP005932-PA n=1 Tax=Anopheles gambiae TaxID=7165 RepID=Q5TRA4_ANOGA|nr:AGAP005932-PA [Anopheles gambiae str. PEST]